MTFHEDRPSTGIANHLAHVRDGVPMRELARREGVEPSTIMRRINRLEREREACPLTDSAFADAEARRDGALDMDAAAMRRECKTALRRLCETGSEMAAVKGSPAKIYRPGPIRNAVLGQCSFMAAQAMAIHGWLRVDEERGRVMICRATPAGRRALAAMVGARDRDSRRRLTEQPMIRLARKYTWSGEPHLTTAMVAAGTELVRLSDAGETRRVTAALKALGPGLADVVRMVCLDSSGMQEVERDLKLSPRSGKDLLRLGLGRLAGHLKVAE